jgi:hypothetical protein
VGTFAEVRTHKKRGLLKMHLILHYSKAPLRFECSRTIRYTKIVIAKVTRKITMTDTRQQSCDVLGIETEET